MVVGPGAGAIDVRKPLDRVGIACQYAAWIWITTPVIGRSNCATCASMAGFSRPCGPPAFIVGRFVRRARRVRRTPGRGGATAAAAVPAASGSLADGGRPDAPRPARPAAHPRDAPADDRGCVGCR